MSQFDVAIVGAGMVGASLACGLIDAGFKVALIESGELSPSQDCFSFEFSLRKPIKKP